MALSLRLLTLFLISVLIAVVTHGAVAATLNLDVQQKYGTVSIAAIDRAIAEARNHFLSSPNDTVVISLPSGVFPLALESPEFGSIDVSDVQPGPSGRLIIQGAGKERTILVFNTHTDQIVGRHAAHIVFTGIHFTAGYMTVSQGHVAQVLPGAIVLNIESGFPSPLELLNTDAPKGVYLRRCTDSLTDPHIIENDNEQVRWGDPVHLSGSLWQLNVALRPGSTPFRIGDLVAIKSKHGNGNTYRFIASEDITFDNVIWTRLTRGVFRAGTHDVKILNAAILRDPPVNGQVPCLSSAAGGPQFGQPNDEPSGGFLVQNYVATGTGDDAIAFFNASGRVDNARIADSFARGILLYHSPNVDITNVQVESAPILRQ